MTGHDDGGNFPVAIVYQRFTILLEFIGSLVAEDCSIGYQRLRVLFVLVTDDRRFVRLFAAFLLGVIVGEKGGSCRNLRGKLQTVGLSFQLLG